MAYRRDDMWSEGRYEYDRLPRERLPPRSHPEDEPSYRWPRDDHPISRQPDYRIHVIETTEQKITTGRKSQGLRQRQARRQRKLHRVVTSVHLHHDPAPTLLDLPDRSQQGDSVASPTTSLGVHQQPPLAEGDKLGDTRDGFRRKGFYPSHYGRERSPHKRDNPFFRESPVNRKDSPHSRSGSSVSSRSYSPERSKAYSFHQSQHRSKERPSVQSLKTSRDTSPSSSTAAPSSKVLDKPSRLTEKELAEAANKWAAEKLEKTDENNLPEISDYDAGSSAPLYDDQPEEPETNATDSIELFEDNQVTSRSKAIASKTKEIEQVYRQDCETFGMVVKMLIDKDPSLEKSVQFALRQNLHEIGERCIEELKHFIAEYDAANQEFGESF
ncbi:periphilin-1 isoform X2 [Trichosurus vulpecula]|uniref:periphilin-1 isoform X2 n=1 Tax=Trichosurus vulpecula TaxID=9337 RepID=UPI00186AD4A3|nr:periphilin-1 isoform X2 [Trichosurus vulpecula]